MKLLKKMRQKMESVKNKLKLLKIKIKSFFKMKNKNQKYQQQNMCQGPQCLLTVKKEDFFKIENETIKEDHTKLKSNPEIMGKCQKSDCKDRCQCNEKKLTVLEIKCFEYAILGCIATSVVIPPTVAIIIGTYLAIDLGISVGFYLVKRLYKFYCKKNNNMNNLKNNFSIPRTAKIAV